MSIIPKEVIRELIREKRSTSPDDVLATLKEMFREALLESLGAELDEQLGYDVNDNLKLVLWGDADVFLDL